VRARNAKGLKLPQCATDQAKWQVNLTLGATMDDLDRQLVGHLRQDARQSVAVLATRLGVSRGTVTNRIRKLEDEGVIVGYTIKLRPDSEPNDIRAWMSIAVEGNETRKVIASLLGEPGVASLHDTNGRWDLLAELRATNLSELSRIMERVRLDKGIRASETSIHLETYRLS
jgi:DNA-binding Lrp family transcriptional regulator